MAMPQRITAITPFQKYLQDTMRADTTPTVGMMSLLATDPSNPEFDGVYVKAPPKLVGGAPIARPFTLITSPTEIGLKYAFGRIANDNTQQVDIFTSEQTTTDRLVAIYNRMLYLFDEKKPVIAGFRALRKTRVEFIGAFDDQDGGAHAIAMINPTLQVL